MESVEEKVELFNKLLDEAREEFPEHSDYSLQLVCWKLAVDGNLDEMEDPEEIEKVKSRYVN